MKTCPADAVESPGDTTVIIARTVVCSGDQLVQNAGHIRQHASIRDATMGTIHAGGKMDERT